MEKLVITTDEIAGVADPPPGGRAEAKLPAAIPLWLRIGLSPLFLVLPILGVVSIIVSLMVRNREPRLKYAWVHYLFSLLVVSSFVTTIAAVGYWFWPPRHHGTASSASPASQPFGLDTLAAWPEFTEGSSLSTEELVRKMQPVVLIVSRVLPGMPPTRERLADVGFGAGVLLLANEQDYLIATARHVVGDVARQETSPDVAGILVWSKEGGYARAEVLGNHKSLDLALLRVSRHNGKSAFTQPVCPYPQIALGGRVVAMGHPQGMFYSVSDGLISRLDGTGIIQISAPISPGASGGPVYDLRGRLLGIIISQVNKESHPQAENLNFAVRADAFLERENWDLTKAGGDLLAKYVLSSSGAGVRSPGSPPAAPEPPAPPSATPQPPVPSPAAPRTPAPSPAPSRPPSGPKHSVTPP